MLLSHRVSEAEVFCGSGDEQYAGGGEKSLVFCRVFGDVARLGSCPCA
jgi:hypothetical protein